VMRIEAQHLDTVDRDGLDRHQVHRVGLARHAEEDAASVLRLADDGMDGPGRVLLRDLERVGVLLRVGEPLDDRGGIALFGQRAADKRLEIAGLISFTARRCTNRRFTS
jgi:hypothetical protein